MTASPASGGRAVLAAATLGVLCLLLNESRAASWQPITAAGGSPPPRRDAAMVHDRPRGRLVLFGGRGVGGQVLNDTWAFDLASRAWGPLATGPALRPPGRFSMVFGIDPRAHRLLIATGQDAGGFFNDLWSLDLHTDVWSEVTPATQDLPPERYGSGGGIFDPATFAEHDGALVLSHGFTFSGRFDDTWTFDPGTDRWTDDSPVGTRPLRRCLHAAAPAGPDRFVIFGGCASGFGPCPLDDTWVFDRHTGTWTDLTSGVGPDPRFFPSMTTMGDGDDVLLFGGRGTANMNDLWRLDAASGNWTALTASGPAPSARQSASLVWIDGTDPALGGEACGYALLFGGAASTGEQNDLFELVPAAAPALPQISASKDGPSGVKLSWAHQAAAGSYEVWRSDRPDFASGPDGPIRLPGDPTISAGAVTHTDASGDLPAPIFFYRVRVSRCELF